MKSWWTIVGTISSILATIAAIIAAYYSFLSRPKKVKDINVGIEEIISLNDENKWEVKFNICNSEEKVIAKEGIVVIKTNHIKLISVNPQKGAGGLLTVPSVVFDKSSFNYSFEKLKPRTRQILSINMEVEPDDYTLEWYAYGENIKDVNGEVKLNLKENI